MDQNKKTIRTRKHNAEFIIPLIIFIVFTLSAVAVVLFAARTYQQTVASSEANYQARVVVSYVAQKIRSCDTSGRIYTGVFDGQDALILEYSYDGKDYLTSIYEDGYYLYEFTSYEDILGDASAGERVFPLMSFEAEEIVDGVFKISCVDLNGRYAQTFISQRSDPALADPDPDVSDGEDSVTYSVEYIEEDDYEAYEQVYEEESEWLLESEMVYEDGAEDADEDDAGQDLEELTEAASEEAAESEQPDGDDAAADKAGVGLGDLGEEGVRR